MQPRDQYQHCIPRFILRRFQVKPDMHKTKKQRQREYRQAKKNPSLSTLADHVLVYDVEARVLQSRPLRVVYGETNLYKDITHIENFNHIEEKLSRLESDAAVFVNNLHNAIANTGGSVTVTRKELGIFRKFLFIMHNRSRHFQFSYFNADLPENSLLREWIRNRKWDKDMRNDKEVWLDSLRYHLENPHHKIIAEGEDIMKEYGGASAMFTEGKFDPSTNMYAVEYTTNANESYMGIWEAADDSEFVIGSNSFGLWEGKYVPSGAGAEAPGIHRLFPLSPRLVIVCRLAILRDFTSEMAREIFRGEISSDLFDIAVESAVPRYPNYRGALEDIEQYRRSDIAQKDTYTFKITQLTKVQTQAVNNVFLLNAVQDGTVSFSSKSRMLESLQAFSKTDILHYIKSMKVYAPLMNELASNSLQ